MRLSKEEAVNYLIKNKQFIDNWSGAEMFELIQWVNKAKTKTIAQKILDEKLSILKEHIKDRKWFSEKMEKIPTLED